MLLWPCVVYYAGEYLLHRVFLPAFHLPLVLSFSSKSLCCSISSAISTIYYHLSAFVFLFQIAKPFISRFSVLQAIFLTMVKISSATALCMRSVFILFCQASLNLSSLTNFPYRSSLGLINIHFSCSPLFSSHILTCFGDSEVYGIAYWTFKNVHGSEATPCECYSLKRRMQGLRSVLSIAKDRPKKHSWFLSLHLTGLSVQTLPQKFLVSTNVWLSWPLVCWTALHLLFSFNQCHTKSPTHT